MKRSFTVFTLAALLTLSAFMIRSGESRQNSTTYPAADPALNEDVLIIEEVAPAETPKTENRQPTGQTPGASEKTPSAGAKNMPASTTNRPDSGMMNSASKTENKMAPAGRMYGEPEKKPETPGNNHSGTKSEEIRNSEENPKEKIPPKPESPPENLRSAPFIPGESPLGAAGAATKTKTSLPTKPAAVPFVKTSMDSTEGNGNNGEKPTAPASVKPSGTENAAGRNPNENLNSVQKGIESTGQAIKHAVESTSEAAKSGIESVYKEGERVLDATGLNRKKEVEPLPETNQKAPEAAQKTPETNQKIIDSAKKNINEGAAETGEAVKRTEEAVKNNEVKLQEEGKKALNTADENIRRTREATGETAKNAVNSASEGAKREIEKIVPTETDKKPEPVKNGAVREVPPVSNGMNGLKNANGVNGTKSQNGTSGPNSANDVNSANGQNNTSGLKSTNNSQNAVNGQKLNETVKTTEPEKAEAVKTGKTPAEAAPATKNGVKNNGSTPLPPAPDTINESEVLGVLEAVPPVESTPQEAPKGTQNGVTAKPNGTAPKTANGAAEKKPEAAAAPVKTETGKEAGKADEETRNAAGKVGEETRKEAGKKETGTPATGQEAEKKEPKAGAEQKEMTEEEEKEEDQRIYQSLRRFVTKVRVYLEGHEGQLPENLLVPMLDEGVYVTELDGRPVVVMQCISGNENLYGKYVPEETQRHIAKKGITGSMKAMLPKYYIGALTMRVPETVRVHYHIPEDLGLWVEYVLPDSPAAKADIHRGDLILAAYFTDEAGSKHEVIFGSQEEFSEFVSNMQDHPFQLLLVCSGKQRYVKIQAEKNEAHEENAGEKEAQKGEKPAESASQEKNSVNEKPGKEAGEKAKTAEEMEEENDAEEAEAEEVLEIEEEPGEIIESESRHENNTRVLEVAQTIPLKTVALTETAFENEAQDDFDWDFTENSHAHLQAENIAAENVSAEIIDTAYPENAQHHDVKTHDMKTRETHDAKEMSAENKKSHHPTHGKAEAGAVKHSVKKAESHEAVKHSAKKPETHEPVKHAEEKAKTHETMKSEKTSPEKNEKEKMEQKSTEQKPTFRNPPAPKAKARRVTGKNAYYLRSARSGNTVAATPVTEPSLL